VCYNISGINRAPMAFCLKQKNSGFFLVLAVLISSMFLAFPVKAESYCGDGNADPNEECDDGNFVNRDGCSTYCKIEDMASPTVLGISIPTGSTGISTITKRITIRFSESLDPQTINANTVKLKHAGIPMDTRLELGVDGKTLAILVNQDLFAGDGHAITVENIKDTSGNVMPFTIVSAFTAGTAIDHTAPNPVANPPGGDFNVAQSVTLKAYVGNYTGSDEFLDPEATVYYTIDGAIPSETSPKYTTPFTIFTNKTLRFFGMDKVGNRSETKMETYNFACAENPNAVKMTPYPACRIEECKIGFELKSNVCVARLGNNDPNDYKLNAVTAPMLPSDSPVNIISKPALYVTPQHQGVLPRPILFKETKRGTVIRFEKDTKITDEKGNPFTGYILPPENLYSKDFPINFGYTFKSIFKMAPAEGGMLFFNPPYSITIPYGEGYEAEESVTVFTFNATNQQYSMYPADQVAVNLNKKTVTIKADKTNTFFLAQSGKSFNKAVFKDTVGHWARNYIEALYRKGIVKGRDTSVFAPDDSLTRAEFIKVALAAAGIKTDAEIIAAPFDDVPLFAWYAPYIRKAKDLGLTKGYADGTFKPEQPINRAEAVHLLVKAFGFDVAKVSKANEGKEKKYKDLLSDQWYYPAVRFSIQNDLLGGIRTREGNIVPYFKPERAMTRGEMAELAVKAMELKGKK